MELETQHRFAFSTHLDSSWVVVSPKDKDASFSCQAVFHFLAKYLSATETNYQVLHNFGSIPGDGAMVNFGNLTASDSILYGTTTFGGANDSGVLFKINTNSTDYSIMHRFGESDDGSYPNTDLTLIGSTLYGTCQFGGACNSGTIFKIDANNNYTTIYSFDGSNQAGPAGGLTLIGSRFYGTTFHGGVDNHGTIFSINIDGTSYRDLYEFTSGPDGEQPWGKLATDGSYLYGVNDFGGVRGAGVLYKIKCDGTDFAILHNNYGGSFTAQPPTIVGSTLYCAGGGTAADSCDLYQINTDGTGFRELHSFGGYTAPMGGLAVIGSTLYGTTSYGGDHNDGFIYSLQVPEPATLTLLGMSAFSLLAWTWRRSRKAV